MKKTQSFTLLALVAMLGLAGCRDDDGPTVPTPTSGNTYKLNSNVKLLEPGQIQLTSQTETSMVLSGNVPVFRVGDVVVSTLGDGALRRVVSVSKSQNTTTLQTQQAGFADAFKNLDFRFNRPLTSADLGTLPTVGQGIELSWVDSPAASINGTTAAVAGQQSIKVDFKKFSLSASRGIELDGSASFQLNPNLAVNLVRQSGQSGPTITLDASVSPSYSHILTVSSTYGGSISGNLEREIRLGSFPIPGVPVRATAYLTLRASISGTAAGKFGTSYTASMNGVAALRRGLDGQFTTERNFNALNTGKFDHAEASLGVEVVPVEVGLEFRFYGVGGPYFTFYPRGTLTGSFEVDGLTGKEGIRAKVQGSIGGSIGIGGNLDFLKVLFKDVSGGSFTVAELEYTIGAPSVLFDKFFPFPNRGNIVVADNGSSADDIFEVAVGGVVLGRTTKGGSGQFRVGSLAPGSTQLRLTTIEDDDPPGTYGITLDNGVTFSDGSRTRSGGLALGSSVTFTIVIPDSSSTSPVFAAPPRMPRNNLREAARQ
jgi:hypothetical protein